MSGRLPTSAEISFDIDGFDDMQIGAGNKSIDRNSRNNSSANRNSRDNFTRSADPRNNISRPQNNSSRQQNRPHSRPQNNPNNRPQNIPVSSSTNSRPPPPKIIPLINNYQFSSSPPTVQELIQHFNFILIELEKYAPESQDDAPIEKFGTQFKNAVTDSNLTPVDSSKINQQKIEFPKYLSELIRLISHKVKYAGDKLEKQEKEEIKGAVFGFVDLLRLFDRIFGVDCVDL